MTRNRLADQAVIERNRRARDDFQSGRHLSPFVIDPAVVRAWQRCVRMGLQADQPIAFEPVHRNAARAVLESNRDLLTAASAELDMLGRTLVPSGASVMLADASLHTIAIRGAVGSMPEPLRAISREGVDLSESVIGSNALSIAAIEQAPSVVLRNAHFCESNSVFSCAAAPIRGPQGNLLGVLDVTTCLQALPLEAAVVVNTSARAIENGIFRHDANHLVVRFHPRADLVDTPLQAVVRCSVAGEIVGANEAALALLGLRWPLRGVRFARCFRMGVAELLAQAGRRETFQVGLWSRSGMPVNAVVTMPAATRHGRAGATPVKIGHSPIAGESAPDTALRLLGAEGLQTVQASAADPQLHRVMVGFNCGIPVLILGESGSGKTTSARLLHDQGPASHGPFQVLLCGGLDAAALDAGIAAAAGGTCLLSEVADLNETMQARLLRLLQQRLAGRPRDGAAAADPLLISTSHRDLHTLCEAGRFRYDLYYRLKGQLLALQPLRDRDDRDRLIVRALRCAFQVRHGAMVPAPDLDPRVLACLVDYRWPGNLRELDWVARLLANACGPGQRISLDLLPAEIGLFHTTQLHGPRRSPALGGGELTGEDASVGALRDMRDRAITQAVARHQGNLSRAARDLGVSRGTLYRRLKALQGKETDLPLQAAIR